MDIFFFSLKKKKIAKAIWCQQSGGISPHAGQTAECIHEYILPPTSYVNSIQQSFIPPLKKQNKQKKHPQKQKTKQKTASIFFSPNKTHILAASFEIHIIMLF